MPARRCAPIGASFYLSIKPSRGGALPRLPLAITFRAVGAQSLRNQSQLFSQLYGLGPAPGTQLVEQAAGMGLDGVFADKEFFGDLAIAQAVGNQLEDLQLARSNAEF